MDEYSESYAPLDHYDLVLDLRDSFNKLNQGNEIDLEIKINNDLYIKHTSHLDG